MWKTEKEVLSKDALNYFNVTASLDSAERLFQYFAPLNEKHFWPFAVLYSGNYRVARDAIQLALLVVQAFRICRRLVYFRDLFRLFKASHISYRNHIEILLCAHSV